MQLILMSLISKMHQSPLNNKLWNILFSTFQFWSCILTNIMLNFCTGGTCLHLRVVWALPQEKTPRETTSPYKNKSRNGSTPISISQRMTSSARLKEWASWRCLTDSQLLFSQPMMITGGKIAFSHPSPNLLLTCHVFLHFMTNQKDPGNP